MDKFEESLTSLTLRAEKLEESVRSWPHSRYPGTGRGEGTPVIREKNARDKRWSVDSVSSVMSLSQDVHHKPFIWQMPFTVKCIGTFKLVLSPSLFSSLPLPQYFPSSPPSPSPSHVALLMVMLGTSLWSLAWKMSARTIHRVSWFLTPQTPATCGA